MSFKINAFGTPSSVAPNTINNIKIVQDAFFSIDTIAEDKNSVVLVPPNIEIPVILDTAGTPVTKNFTYLPVEWPIIPGDIYSHVIQYNGTVERPFLVLTNASLKYDPAAWAPGPAPISPIDFTLRLKRDQNNGLNFSETIAEKNIHLHTFLHSYTANTIITLVPGDRLWYFAESAVTIPINGLVKEDLNINLVPV